MSQLEERLRAAATRMPGPYRNDAEESGPNEVRSLVSQMPDSADPAAEILGRFLESGDTDEARLAAYLVGELPLAASAVMTGYKRSDLPALERSKLAWSLGRSLVDGSVAMVPEVTRWVQDRADGPAFWGAYFLRDRPSFERDAPAQLARSPIDAANQLWFAATLLRDAEYVAFLDALRALGPTFGAPWVQQLETTLDAVRQSSAPADRALPARA